MRPTRLKNRSWHYGWLIVLAGFLTLFACLGLARFAYGVLLPSMRAGLGLAYDQMGFVSTGNFAGYLAAVALAPQLVRRLRPRATIVIGLSAIALGMLAISRCDRFLPLLVLYTVVGMGSGFANIPMMILVSHWFRKQRRGRAAGLMIMGNGAAILFAGFLIPELNRQLGDAGWRWGWAIPGAISLVITAVVAVLLRNDPQELGLTPLGEAEPLPEEAFVGERRGGGRILLLLGAVYLVFGFTYMIYGTFIVTTMVDELGLSQERAGMLWSLVGFFSIFSGVLFGALSDRIGRREGLMVVFAVQTGAYLLAGAGSGVGVLVCSIVLYGLSAFAIPTIMAAAVGDYLGIGRAPAAFALVTFFFAFGQTLGPATAGILAEAMGSFSVSYLAAAAMTGLAVGLSAFLPPVRQGS